MPNANLLTTIKKAALEAVNASRPVNIVFGTLASLEPVTVYIEQKLVLDSSFLVVTKTIADRIENEELMVGDRLLLLQVQGGQRYVVIDKVVS